MHAAPLLVIQLLILDPTQALKSPRMMYFSPAGTDKEMIAWSSWKKAFLTTLPAALLVRNSTPRAACFQLLWTSADSPTHTLGSKPSIASHHASK